MESANGITRQRGRRRKCSFFKKVFTVVGCWMENIWSRCIRDASWTVKDEKEKVSAMKYGIKTIHAENCTSLRALYQRTQKTSLNLSRMRFIRSLPDT